MGLATVQIGLRGLSRKVEVVNANVCLMPDTLPGELRDVLSSHQIEPSGGVPSLL